jgi:hypothetical protein
MIRALLRNAGVDPRRIASAVADWRRYARDRAAYRRMASGTALPWGLEMPILGEHDLPGGTAGPYFQQDLIVARWIHEHRPERHVDVGSRIDGFVGHLAVFREVDVLDIRPPSSRIPNVRFHGVDIMQELPAPWTDCTDSLSCLHSIEHFGLGRYGDPIDPEGHLKGLRQLKRMLKKRGTLYLSTLVGEERVEFNAHRVFAQRTVADWFAGSWSIERSALVDSAGEVQSFDSAQGLAAPCADLSIAIVAARKTS